MECGGRRYLLLFLLILRPTELYLQLFAGLEYIKQRMEVIRGILQTKAFLLLTHGNNLTPSAQAMLETPYWLYLLIIK